MSRGMSCCLRQLVQAKAEIARLKQSIPSDQFSCESHTRHPVYSDNGDFFIEERMVFVKREGPTEAVSELESGIEVSVRVDRPLIVEKP